MIELSNGHRFQFMAASGALGYDGWGWPHEKLLPRSIFDPTLFTVVIKTLTGQPRKGNLRWWWPWGCIRPLPGGVVNAVGLSNPGIGWWCKKIGPTIDRRRLPLVGSIYSENPEEVGQMAAKLDGFGLVALEINASCPNTGPGLLDNAAAVVSCCLQAKANCRHPLLLKLSVVHDIAAILPQVAEGLVEGIAINSVPWQVVFPDRRSPLAHLGGGGVSGRIVQGITWPFLRRIRELTEIPVIGPSVWNWRDVFQLFFLGAQAVSFGSVFLLFPWRPTSFVKRYLNS